MSSQRLILDLSDLAVERIETVPANSLDSATYGHGTHELAASCEGGCGEVACSCGCEDIYFMADKSEDV
jgi:hypothetical protein